MGCSRCWNQTFSEPGLTCRVRFERTWAGRDQPLHQGGCNPWENPLWPLRAPAGQAMAILVEALVARSLVAACLAFAGVFVLAGAGWALLAGAFLVFAAWRREPDWAVLRARGAAASRRVAAQVKARPRRATAVGGMTGGSVLLPIGLGLVSGLGVAVAACGGLLIGLSLLAGQGA